MLADNITEAKRDGAYYTPESVVQALVCWAVRSDSDRLLDPSCGDGRFLRAYDKSTGVEQNPAAAKAAAEGAPTAVVHRSDFFEWAEVTSERFECVAGNPPFIRYQRFSGDVRARALRLCRHLGAQFSGLTSSWAPFIVGAAGLLKSGGRIAFVVPAEIGHAPYAAPLIDYLCENFCKVQIIAVREKLFPDLSEDCWLLYAEGYGGSCSRFRFTAQSRFEWSARPPLDGIDISLREWREDWNCRLRPFILPASARAAYREVAGSPESRRLGEISRLGIGYVSGGNDFFHLRPSEVDHWKIPRRFLHPSIRNGRKLKGRTITAAMVRQWEKDDDPLLLLRIKPTDTVPSEVKRYLDADLGQRVRLGYKCRNRSPWYAVPDVRIPDFVLSYMTGRSTTLAANQAGVTCSNTMHGIHLRDPCFARDYLSDWGSDFVELSCEVEGHALGGGMLKLEVREASRVLLPGKADLGMLRPAEWKGAVSTLRAWRHYGD